MYKETLPQSTQNILKGCQEFFGSKAAAKPFPNSYFQEKPTYSICSLGVKVPFANAVWRHTSLEVCDLHHLIDQFENQNMPFFWWEPPTPAQIQTPPLSSFNSLLIERGLQFSGYLKGVEIETSTQQSNPPSLLPAFTIQKVQNSQELKTFCHCIFSLFGLTTEIIDQLYHVMNQPLEETKEVHYIAYDNQIPIGGITVSMNQVAGIWNFITHSEYQKQGLETALMFAALAEAEQAGYKQAMAMFMPGEETLWSQCGWQDICHFPFYHHSGNSVSHSIQEKLTLWF